MMRLDTSAVNASYRVRFSCRLLWLEHYSARKTRAWSSISTCRDGQKITAREDGVEVEGGEAHVLLLSTSEPTR